MCVLIVNTYYFAPAIEKYKIYKNYIIDYQIIIYLKSFKNITIF